MCRHHDRCQRHDECLPPNPPFIICASHKSLDICRFVPPLSFSTSPPLSVRQSDLVSGIFRSRFPHQKERIPVGRGSIRSLSAKVNRVTL